MEALIVSEPGVDGVFRYVETLCRFLSNRGVGVHLAYSDRRGSDRLTDLVRWIERRGGRTLNLHVANRPEFGDVNALRMLHQFVREVRPDVIHSHSSKAGFLARSLAALGTTAPQVYHPHAYVGMRPIPGRFDFVYNCVEAALARVSHTIVVSASELEFAERHLRVPDGRLRLVPNGVDTNRFTPVPPEAKRELRATFGLPTDRPVLGFMARCCAQKDPVTLYRAFARVVADVPVALFHVGKGELDHEVERAIDECGLRDSVWRCPYMHDTSAFYQVVDGFVLTSRYEGLSLAALEALSANLPLILSDAPGNEDLLALPLSHGWHAAPGDVEGFADAISEWVDACRLGEEVNHREIACERFDEQLACESILTLYRDLANEPVDALEEFARTSG